ncbi:hypothetical protein GCM10010435_18840 [Winogradskya consettensis]|uniref:Uncharacterized protein n=1 Tax=Winogradskya consettensis TaxID=113560 RepID=A0A919STR6_9ACTN|nr:hypothetical protein [Actinoplanes consettensis]GIM78391.1 hypothetical protein Aco04nite_60210 [Actinoplanes consettensis]
MLSGTRESPSDETRLAHTVGLRAAGSYDNVVLLGGPALENTLNTFAFDATTQKYLGPSRPCPSRPPT